MVRVHPGLLEPRYANRQSGSARAPTRSVGRERLQVRILFWVLVAKTTWLGRQMADHLGLEPGMRPTLRVGARFESHLSYSKNNMSSWSSPECSPPCQGGDRGFKSHRGRFDNDLARYANGKAAKLKPS